MSKQFDTNVETWTKARISSSRIADILEKEKDSLLGGEDCFIKTDGYIHESDYRLNGTSKIRKATQEEIELNEAFYKVIQHFKSL